MSSVPAVTGSSCSIGADAAGIASKNRTATNQPLAASTCRADCSDGRSVMKTCKRFVASAIWAAATLGVAATPSHAQQAPLSASVIGADITTLDPARATTTTDLVPVGWIYNGLVRFKPGSADPKDLEPDLAASGTTRPTARPGPSISGTTFTSRATGARSPLTTSPPPSPARQTPNGPPSRPNWPPSTRSRQSIPTPSASR